MTKLEKLRLKIVEEETAALDLKKQYEERRIYINELKIQAIAEHSGMRVGAIVTSGKNQTEFLVSRIQPMYSVNGFLLYGRKKTKGGWSKGEQHITSWTIKR
jgi:hypothetical protein